MCTYTRGPVINTQSMAFLWHSNSFFLILGNMVLETLSSFSSFLCNKHSCDLSGGFSSSHVFHFGNQADLQPALNASIPLSLQPQLPIFPFCGPPSLLQRNGSNVLSAHQDLWSQGCILPTKRQDPALGVRRGSPFPFLAAGLTDTGNVYEMHVEMVPSLNEHLGTTVRTES